MRTDLPHKLNVSLRLPRPLHDELHREAANGGEAPTPHCRYSARPEQEQAEGVRPFCAGLGYRTIASLATLNGYPSMHRPLKEVPT